SWPDFRLEVETILRLARPVASGRVLELGCGSGALLRTVAPIARLAGGMDISAAGRELAAGWIRQEVRGRTGVGLLCARAEKLPFDDGSFDAVVSQHLVEHLDDPSAALAEWYRVLRPGGILVLVTPNGDYPDPEIFADPTHNVLFTHGSLRSYLSASGFHVDRLFTLFPYLGRGRVARFTSIRLARVARQIPGLNLTGRSLVASATRM
ncbi:MAG TPA: class I SAM-dependent methyltransferase, partial [Chloroflexota bacterium]|nr:class I SAM-dependent methyltransferase [Chloroflexota bacterium]